MRQGPATALGGADGESRPSRAPYARLMGIIDGERWIAQRLKFLRERLAGEQLSEDERQAIEAEIEALEKAPAIPPAALVFPRRLLRLRRKR